MLRHFFLLYNALVITRRTMKEIQAYTLPLHSFLLCSDVVKKAS